MNTTDSPSLVFLHSMWRARSTYVFGCFRAQGQFHCYYEPLNESLATNDHLVADQQSRQKRLHHSDLGGGYFDEYDGLWNPDGHGARLFRARYAYYPFDASNDPSEYLRLLLSRSPKPHVLMQPCRSPLRLRYFRTEFPAARHFFLKRDATEQFRSYCVNEYFIPTHLAYAYLQPAARAELASRFPGLLDGLSDGEAFASIRQQVQQRLSTLLPGVVREVFQTLWELALEDAVRNGVQVVDVDNRAALEDAFSSYGISLENFRRTHARHEKSNS